MKKQRVLILILTFLLMAGLIFGVGKLFWGWKLASAVTADDVLQKTLAKRDIEIPEIKPAETVPLSETELKDKKTINILLLGIDARKTQEESTGHCDAIHMFSLNLQNWTVKITSVPRGTYAPLPPGKQYLPTDYYISNSCALVSHKYAINYVEKLINIKADYVVEVGFSETYGILRTLKLPTAESLQWLRNRQTFAIGDPQRSHNQAVFMKDVAVKEIDSLSSSAMIPLAQIAYSFGDSDLDFASFYALVRGYAASGLGQHPERITLNMIPAHNITDYHFDFADPASMTKKYPLPAVMITPNTPAPAEQLAEAQKDIIKYLTLRIAGPESVADIYEKKLWLQVEDEATREDLQYKLTERLATESKKYEDRISVATEYVFEKQTLGPAEYFDKGKELMKRIIESKNQ
jgi:hypothetical protein